MKILITSLIWESSEGVRGEDGEDDDDDDDDSGGLVVAVTGVAVPVLDKA
jgi:hypothetical protein